MTRPRLHKYAATAEAVAAPLVFAKANKMTVTNLAGIQARLFDSQRAFAATVFLLVAARRYAGGYERRHTRQAN